jgi:hypothetical protein
MLRLLPQDKSFIYSYIDAETIQTIKADPYHIVPHNEIAKQRSKLLIDSISEEKLMNSNNKSAKGKGYSDKELTEMLILLGENTSGLKNSHIVTLLKIKRSVEHVESKDALLTDVKTSNGEIF